MKKFSKFFLVFFVALLLTGCISSDDSDYTVDRKRDFNDIFTIGLTGGLGGTIQAGPALIGGLFSGSASNNKKMKAQGTGFCMQKNTYDRIHWARNKNFHAYSLGLSFAIPANQHAWSYYTQFEGGGGFILPGPFIGFNPGELLDWSLGYFGIDIYDDDIGLPPTFEEDLLALNQFFIENNGNLSLTDKEQTVVCHEYENARVYQFKNYSLAIFPLYWQKYGVYDFIVFVNDSVPHCERLSNFGINENYNSQNPIFNAKYKIGFFDKFLGDKIPSFNNIKIKRFNNDGTVHWDYRDIERNNGEDRYIYEKLTGIRIYGNFDVQGIKKVNLVNSDTSNDFQNTDYIISDLISKKEIKITLPVNHKFKHNKSK